MHVVEQLENKKMESSQDLATTYSLPEPDFGSFWRLDAQNLALTSLQSIIKDLNALQNHLFELRGINYRAKTLLPSSSLYNPAREFWEQGGQKYLEVMACLKHMTSMDDTSKLFVYTSALSVADFNLQPIRSSLSIQQTLDVLVYAGGVHAKEKIQHFAEASRAGTEDEEVMERLRLDLIQGVTHLQFLAHEAKIGLMQVVGFVKHTMYGLV